LSRLPAILQLDRRGLVWLTQVFVVVGVLGYSIANMLGGDFLTSREALQFLPSGMHWFAVVIFVAVFLGYIAMDRRVNLLFIVPIGLVYYCLHEAIFNALFIPYNGFQAPAGGGPLWYTEIEIVLVVTLAFIPFAYRFRHRLLRFMKSAAWKKIAIASWAALAILYAIRIAMGFPVSINIFEFGTMYAGFNSTLANGFELATNIVFAVAFYSTFDFAFRRKSDTKEVSRTEDPNSTGLERDGEGPTSPFIGRV